MSGSFQKENDTMKKNRLLMGFVACVLFCGSCVATGMIPAESLPGTPGATEIDLHRVTPGDIIEVSLWEIEGLTTYEVQTSREGTIDLMFIEDIPVLGLTEEELDEFLTKELSYYYVDPNVIVRIKEVVYVFGETERPGAYTFENGLTLASIIASAGGPTRDAQLKNVLVIRDYYTDPVVIESNFSNLLKKADLHQNITLKGGDIVFLPSTVISDVNYFLVQIQPLLEILLYPTRVAPIP
jgi:protein involved in polysaccharide export with SLBB domain